ncbi:hypothetical protein OJ252_3017 [Cryptosporidium canis]|uniref:C2 NT-type domain-containing protein n=1 Tax=Cryptosporidium canis TaxID=195482 RepID=A0ABQ8P3G1_9CRYT|nr:hypothetical protein OJ252_3017 [Cryptosporidium canis]
MRLVRAVRHIGQNAEKFRFDLKVENLHVQLHEECEITIDWIRGPKRISGKETVSCVNGSIIHPFYQPMVLIATLFQKSPQKAGRGSSVSEAFLPKDSRLAVYGKFKDNPLVSLIGEVPLELSGFANSSRQSCYEVSEPVRVEIPLIKCSDPDSYIEICVTCSSLGQVSEGFDDTASMMSGFTTVYSEVSEHPIHTVDELRGSLTDNRDLSCYKRGGTAQRGGVLGQNSESKKDSRRSCEGTLGIPMFSIKEDTEIGNEAIKETEELTETATIVDVEVHDRREAAVSVVEETASFGGVNVGNSGMSEHQRTASGHCQGSAVRQSSRSTENFRTFEMASDQGALRMSSPQSSTSYEILTQRLFMEQEEYKRRMHESSMEINSLRQQLQIYSEQERSWKKREAELMNEIMVLRNGEDLADRTDGRDCEDATRDQRVVGLEDYCLLQQEVSELTGIRDELRRLRESDRLKYEKYIAQLENQIQDITKQLEFYQRSGQIQDQVEEEMFSVPRHPGSFATANSRNSGSVSVGRSIRFVAPADAGESTGDQTSSGQAKDGQQARDSSGNNFSYGFEEIERELISTKLALAQTETNYQIEINNLRNKLEKKRKQLLSYSSYVGSLEVINANLKYGARVHDDLRPNSEDFSENVLENQNGQPYAGPLSGTGGKSKIGGNLNAINSYWKTFKQRLR